METAEPRTLTEDPVRTARASPPPDGFPRTATFAASARSPHTGQGQPLGVREPLAPHTVPAGPRSEASASTPAPGPRPEEARLSLRGSLPWVGLGTGRRAGVGETRRAAAGAAAAGKISTRTRLGRKRKNSAGEGGRGEKPGSGRRKRQGERDIAR